KQVLVAGGKPRLGAVVRFNTTEQIERQRFRILNMSQARLSANILLRNLRHLNKGIDLLFELSKDSSFAMCNRVAWGQMYKNTEFISATTYLKVAVVLHSWVTEGLLTGHHWRASDNFEHLLEKFPRNSIRKNIVTYWEVLNDAFDISRV